MQGKATEKCNFVHNMHYLLLSLNCELKFKVGTEKIEKMCKKLHIAKNFGIGKKCQKLHIAKEFGVITAG